MATQNKMPFLIVGCSRSGTRYTARVLQALGLNVAHENLAPDGSIGWEFAGECPYNGGPTRHVKEWG